MANQARRVASSKSIQNGFEKWIIKSKALHGNRYDYSIVVYRGYKYDVTIRCLVHGEFTQNAGNHATRSGCPECAGVKRLTLDMVLTRARLVHHDRYRYPEQPEPTNNLAPLRVICDRHGEFTQTITNHLAGRGCRQCSTERNAHNRKRSAQEFISQSDLIHHGRYQYDVDDYYNMKTKVRIKCPIHGWFSQLPTDHTTGTGCRKCSRIVSKRCSAWLDSIGLPDTTRHREVTGLIPNRNYTVDGYNPETRTVYEFHGDYWHGNPLVFDPSDYNEVAKKTFGQLYSETRKKQKVFEDAGFFWIEMWQSEWDMTI